MQCQCGTPMTSINPEEPASVPDPAVTEVQDEAFRAQVDIGLAEVDDPAIALIPHESVKARWRERRAALLSEP